jgi:biotin synthase
VCEDDRSDVLRLLDTRIPDTQIDHLLHQADALSRELAGGRGFVWAAIGVDAMPCPMGCGFCSHAAQWQAYRDETALSFEEVAELAEQASRAGADFVALRTTQFYGIERLCDLGHRVRRRIADDVRLVVNTGESNVDDIKALMDAGYTTAYHVVRLREGTDTGHSVEMRVATLDAIAAAGMELQYLIEPLGPEHTAEEILTEARRAREYGAIGTGVMARVPVMGTPLAHLGQVSENYVRRVAAVARLEYPQGGRFLCVHPPAPSSLTAGCNTVVVEQAANPRDSGSSAGPWRSFDLPAARAALKAAGLAVRPV